MTFQPRMIHAFSHALVTDAPAFMPFAGRDPDDYAAYLREVVTDFETRSDAWIRQGRALREELWPSLTERRGNSDDIAALERMIEELAERQKSVKAQARAHERVWRRVIRDAAAVSRAHQDDMREINRRVRRVVERRFEERENFADFLRAARAELAGSRQDAPVFDDPAEMERYLRSALF
ncbi:hypothetical protein [Salinarimonas ramus]|uniref:Uncharacterized protein n=1 Tax=Salinarimonas ramus TaxID=690164 RepID=A0A917V1W6_9HYPH|nr:hypothetical protein [Salinarimonas ramus]GGK18030.1 hypothetical protein GCM10011322_00910 [Salinarimonas ramus]